MDADLTQFRDVIEAASRIVFFTGAGVSTESGIPDFRSPGGIWTRFRPIDFAEFMASREARQESWRRKFETDKTLSIARPNDGARRHRQAGATGEGIVRHHPEHRRAAPGVRGAGRAGHRVARQHDVRSLSRLPGAL